MTQPVTDNIAKKVNREKQTAQAEPWMFTGGNPKALSVYQK